MVTFLVTSLLVLGFLAIAVYFWQKPYTTTENRLPPPSEPHGLFTEGSADESALDAIDEDAEPHAGTRSLLIQRARQGDRTVLLEIHRSNDRDCYNEALDLLVVQADSASKILSLASYITRNELPVTRRHAERFLEAWKTIPDRSSTATMLHLAALSDDAAVYQSAVETAFQFWRAGDLPGVSAQELGAILKGEFWILSSRARNSGAGFLLKRTLASARRELKAGDND